MDNTHGEPFYLLLNFCSVNSCCRKLKWFDDLPNVSLHALNQFCGAVGQLHKVMLEKLLQCCCYCCEKYWESRTIKLFTQIIPQRGNGLPAFSSHKRHYQGRYLPSFVTNISPRNLMTSKAKLSSLFSEKNPVFSQSFYEQMEDATRMGKPSQLNASLCTNNGR